MSKHEAQQALQQIFDQFEQRRQVRRGLLGNSNGTVQAPLGAGWAYIRYHDNLNELSVVRYLIPDQLADGTPVVVGRKQPQDPYEQVLGVDWAMYAWSPSASSVNQHATPAVDLNDLSMGKVVPTVPASLSVDVRAFLYVNGDAAVEFGGGALDLTASVPGVAGHRLALVYVDLDTDALAAEDGAIVALAVDADAPTVPENGLPLGVVDLANGEATIEASDISQYKALYLTVGVVIDLTQLSDYARGHIIRGGAADWEAHDASGDGYAIVGDGTDVASDLTPNWKGTHTWTVGDDQGIIIEMDAAQSVDAFQIKDSGGDVVSGFDERGIVFSDGDTSTTNFYAGLDAGNIAGAGTFNIGIGREVLKALTNGYSNVGIGADVMVAITSGFSNVGVGKGALNGQVDGRSNIAVGGSTLFTSTSDEYNVAIGSAAGFTLDGGDRNIFLGPDAGFRQAVVSNILLIDNQRRADIATELTNAIIYGVMAAAPGNQTLTINATAKTSQGRIVNTTRVVGAYNALVTDHVIFADTDGGAFTVTLPAGVDGQYFRIINCGSSGNDLTIDGNGAENVRGAATQVVSDSEIMILTFETTEEWW